MIKVLRISQGDLNLVLKGSFEVSSRGAPTIWGKATGYAGRATDLQNLTNATIATDTDIVLHEAWQAGTLRVTGGCIEIKFEGMRMTP